MKTTNSASILAFVLLVPISLAGCSDDEPPEPSGGTADAVGESDTADGDEEVTIDGGDDLADSTGDTTEQDGVEDLGDTGLEDQAADGEQEADSPVDLDEEGVEDLGDQALDGPDDLADMLLDTPDDTATEPEVTYAPCNEVPGTAGLVAQTKNAGSAPAPAVEGTIVAGIYHMATDILYGEAGSSDVKSKQRWDITVVSATELTIEIAYRETAPVMRDPESYNATLILTGGANATLEYTCISAPGNPLNDPIPIQIGVNASATVLKVFSQEGTLTHVLTFNLID